MLEQYNTWGDYEQGVFLNNVELIFLVESNYYHIAQLDALIKLFANFKGQYYDKYYPGITAGYELALKIAEDTQAFHYISKGTEKTELHITNVMEFLKDTYC